MAVFKLNACLNGARLCKWEIMKVIVNYRAHDRLTHARHYKMSCDDIKLVHG